MIRRRVSYQKLAQASKAAQKLGFRNGLDYRNGYKKDPLLPSAPDWHYKYEWSGWHSFLGKIAPVSKYSTLAEASEATQLLGVSGQDEYVKYYKSDPRLPACPQTYYLDEWKGWSHYLGKEVREIFASMLEASLAARELGFKTRADYRKGYKQCKLLPADPEVYFKNEWVDWYSFLAVDQYRTISEARCAARKLGVLSKFEYLDSYKQDSRLPACPAKVFRKEWIDWCSFLLPMSYECLADVKAAVKVLKIKDSVEYRSIYKKFPPMPAHPERMFNDEWVDWYDLCEIPRHYEYSKASSIAIAHKINSQAGYRSYIASSGDPRMPKKPDVVYKSCWKNWHAFLGKREPFTVEYIFEPYIAWKLSIVDFMRTARGGKNKESFLCRFLRLFVQKYELGITPELFLISARPGSAQFREFLKADFPDDRSRGALGAINEYLDYVLREKLTVEDEVSGEVVVKHGARNPLLKFTVSFTPSSGLGETCKPALAHQYVCAARNWVIPSEAESFRDLANIHCFDADWMEVDAEVIDVNDPDCVYRQEGGRFKMWCPIYWIHTYSLLSVPARGRQIAYNDSGEGDKHVPVIEGGRLVWKENLSKHSGFCDYQGFVKRYPNDQFGMYFTTNKTSSRGRGYSVAWIPIELAYWLTKLRCWQEKYNPVDGPRRWLDCTRTALNETQRKAKGANFFLFRDFGEQEPGYFTGRLTQRLAAALFNVQPSGLLLASLSGNSTTLSHYSSRYTPHSMRVSLITAYVEEFGLPVEVIMKVAGHSSIIMSIYYLKISSEGLRRRFGEGEKLALKNKAVFAQQMIEQGRADELKGELVSNSDQALGLLSNGISAGSYLFRDYGFCPFAGSRCHDGGEVIGNTHVRAPVSAGYLGSQNCIRCRHFVSGPAFIGGLLSLGNEISLQANIQYQLYDDLEKKCFETRREVDSLDEAEYSAIKSGSSFDDSERKRLDTMLRKTQSESESAAKKLDVFMCDIQAIAKLIKQSQALINNQLETSKDDSLQLIVQLGHELHLALDESSCFQQVCEVCENAEIYESASADIALAPRSQMIDTMVSKNGFPPGMFCLDRKQQLVVGNQIAKFLLSRLKSWDKVDDLIHGRILIKDLADNEMITPKDFDVLFGRNVRRLVDESS